MSSPLKNLVKRLVPEKYRLLRYELYEKGRYYPELLYSLGSRLQCPICRWRFRRFRPAGFDYPVLKERRVVGEGGRRPDVVCPRCKSNERERLLYLYLRNKTSLFNSPAALLHVAPEPNLRRTFRSRPGIRYVTADRFEPDVMVRLDLMHIPFAEGSFDVILCNHVLEHVPDDRQAMRELYRVLKPGGWAILQVPIALALGDTLEDPTATTDEDRVRLFGQSDHVRLYAATDYPSRLRAAGFQVEAYDYARELGEEAVGRHALVRDEKIFICSKPA